MDSSSSFRNQSDCVLFRVGMEPAIAVQEGLVVHNPNASNIISLLDPTD